MTDGMMESYRMQKQVLEEIERSYPHRWDWKADLQFATWNFLDLIQRYQEVFKPEVQETLDVLQRQLRGEPVDPKNAGRRPRRRATPPKNGREGTSKGAHKAGTKAGPTT